MFISLPVTARQIHHQSHLEASAFSTGKPALPKTNRLYVPMHQLCILWRRLLGDAGLFEDTFFKDLSILCEIRILHAIELSLVPTASILLDTALCFVSEASPSVEYKTVCAYYIYFSTSRLSSNKYLQHAPTAICPHQRPHPLSPP